MEVESEFVQMLKAVKSNDQDTIRLLLKAGQRQTTLDSSLCWAARLGNLPLCVLLIDNGADVNAEVWGGFTPIIWSSWFMGNVQVIEYLISKGADVNHRSTKRRQSSLHAAAIKGCYALCELLIHHGADLDCRDYLDKTPLLYAVQRKTTNCVKLLIQNNCNVHLTGFVYDHRLSPLLVSIIQSSTEIMKMLLLAGAKFERTSMYENFSFAQYYQKVEDNLNFEVRPIYLKQQCRVCIRELMKPDFIERLKRMDIPNSLRDFLCMNELDQIGI